MTSKDQILRTIESLPDEAQVPDAIERLYLLYKVQRGIEQADSGQKITQQEARERMARWLK